MPRLTTIGALLLVALSILQLEFDRTGIETTPITIGRTPATLYRQRSLDGPLVVVAHGFAGSRQLMQAFSLTLAHAGYRVLAFDFEGHGRSPVPMSGDVTAIDGTTRLLVEETQRVIDAAHAFGWTTAGIALVGHSMATDVLVRAAHAEREAGRPIDAIVGVAFFSQAVTARFPARLLMVNGEWEGRLRAPSLAALRLVEPDAQEGDTVRRSGVVRRAVVAPNVEHVGVLFSERTLRETREWLDDTFGREGGTTVVTGGWSILALLAGIVLLFRPLVSRLPADTTSRPRLPIRPFLLATLLPAAVTPLLAILPAVTLLPVLVADYLMLHLAVYGVLQLALLPRPWRSISRVSPGAAALLVVWGIGVLGLALDRYVASFLPNVDRLLIIAVLSIGTLPFMIADAHVTEAGRAPFWRRLFARAALIGSLMLAALLDPDRLIFLLLVLPVLVLFYLVHGQLGRWTARRSGALAAGIGLGLCLAWALGVSFPLFDAAMTAGG